MSRWANKYVIGLTGNIAVGKSIVRQMLQHLGAYTIDADGLAHLAMAPGKPAYKPIVETFGQVILNEDKTINRNMLGSMVFSNPALLQRLEAITHPVVRQAIDTLVKRAKQQVVVIEAIKLLEGELAQAVDTVWVVDASPKTQYARLIKKRKMSEDDAKQRILSQGSQKEKLKAADVVIKNDGSAEETWKQVQAGWQKVQATLKAQQGSAAPQAGTASQQAGTASQQKETSQSSTPAAPSSQAQSARPQGGQPAAPAKPQQTEQPKPAAAESDSKPAEKPAEPESAAQPQATPAQPAAGESQPQPDVDVSNVTVKRAMPSNAETIADYITKHTRQETSRMDVIMSFGQKSYLIAEVGGQIQGMVGWQVENLITRVDEIYLEETGNKAGIIRALMKSVEEASQELQSEVSFIFLPSQMTNGLQPFLDSGYEVTTVKEIKIPAWREAVQEIATENMTILSKKLREDRVLKPI